MIIVGRFGSPYGIRGWVKVISYTDPIEKILDYSPWQINRKGKWQLVNIVTGKPHGKNIIVSIADCTNPEQVQAYTNCEIAVERDQLPEPAEDEYYWVDLLGLTVINAQQEILGKVERLLATGANDVLVVIDEETGKQRLIPYINHVIIEVNLAAKRLVVDWESAF
jgi:16S rRNA processing protein RimM